MGEMLLVRAIEAAHQVVAGRVRELDALDAAIGDGDHGSNLLRGLAAASIQRRELARHPLNDALADLARLLASETGGDGGRCYAAVLRGMAGTAPATGSALHLKDLARMLAAGEVALREAGGAAEGGKTMLDVLAPVARALAAGGAAGSPSERAIAAAAFGLHRTSRLAARHGLAAELGAASINHLDPGASSLALLVGAMVAMLEQAAATAAAG